MDSAYSRFTRYFLGRISLRAGRAVVDPLRRQLAGNKAGADLDRCSPSRRRRRRGFRLWRHRGGAFAGQDATG